MQICIIVTNQNDVTTYPVVTVQPGLHYDTARHVLVQLFCDSIILSTLYANAMGLSVRPSVCKIVQEAKLSLG